MPAVPHRPGYFPALDGIRALAILAVIPHNGSVFTESFSAYAYPAVAFVHAGWIGVQLFFVLSGFLITGALLDSRDSPHYYKDFFWRRALRILPLYYGVLIATFIIVPLFVSLPEKLHATQHNQIWLWTFLSNWIEPYRGTVHGFAHFWSLAVEEQFYLLWPFLVRRRTPSSLIRVCLFITLGALVARGLMETLHFPEPALYMFTICRMDALALGAAVAAGSRIPWLQARLQSWSTQIAAAAFVILAFGAAITRLYSAYDGADQIVGYLLLSVAFALIVGLATMPTQGLVRHIYAALAWKPLRLIGKYSFAMYVFHFPLHIFIGEPLLHRLTPHITTTVAIAYLVALTFASFLVGALSYHLYEKHFLRLKNRFGTRASLDPAV